MTKQSKRKPISNDMTITTKDGAFDEITAQGNKKAVKNDALSENTKRVKKDSKVSSKNNKRAAKADVAPRKNTSDSAKNTSAQSTHAAALAARRKKRAKQARAAIKDTDDLVLDQVGGFVTFIREHAVVGLAVGFIVGAQAQTVVKQLVTSFIDPILKLVFGTNLPKAKFSYNGADFTWGAMLYALINLIFVLAAIYALIKLLKLDKLDKSPEKAS